MFNWNQTTVINTLKDLNGKSKIKDAKRGDKVLEGFYLAKYGLFLKENTVEVHKKVAEDAVDGVAKFTIPRTEDGEVYRIKMYVRLSGSNNSYYANDLVFKGKPFVFEFLGGTDATAENLVKKFNSILVAYDDQFLKVSLDDDQIAFTGDNYTLFTEAVIEHFKEESKSITGGTWEKLAEGEITKCVNGFGTYEHITKDLRLPTAEAFAFKALNQEELPIPGAKYNQYTIIYCASRGVQGMDAIGDIVQSQTVHSFYVKEDLATDFEKALAKIEKNTSDSEPEEGDGV